MFCLNKISVLDLLVGDVFRNAARAVPDRVAVALDDATATFGEVDRRANQLARVLAKHGVAHGDVVTVSSPICLELAPLFAALAKLGAVFAPMNPAIAGSEREALLAAARPRLHIADGADIDLSTLVAEAALEDEADVHVPDVRERDAHVVFFTSGSSGRPKGALVSHRVSFLRSHPGALLERRGAMVCPYPLFHMGAWTIALQQWQARGCVVFVHRADAAEICAAVARNRATRLNCIPSVWRRILEHPGAAEELASIRMADTGTSATPLELLQAIERLVPDAELRIFYGSTEAGSVASLAHADLHRKPGSCGVPAPSSEVRVAGDGEVWVRGPLLFDGYLGEADATAAALVDGWYRTGDLAEVDGEGYLTIVGRTGEVIRTGGEAVAPAEVETVVATHPAVVDVAVVGIPDVEWGEIVCAVVVVAPDGDRLDLDAMRSHCADRLTSFKHPRRLVIVDEIPRTAATRQVQRRLLVEQIVAG